MATLFFCQNMSMLYFISCFLPEYEYAVFTVQPVMLNKNSTLYEQLLAEECFNGTSHTIDVTHQHIVRFSEIEIFTK